MQIGIPIRIIDKTHVWVLHFRREDEHGNIPLLGGCGRCTATPRGSFAAHADVQAAWNPSEFIQHFLNSEYYVLISLDASRGRSSAPVQAYPATATTDAGLEVEAR